MYCRNFAVLSSFFDIKKQRPTMNLEKCYQYIANIEISLDLKVYFSLAIYVQFVRPVRSLKFLHRDD